MVRKQAQFLRKYIWMCQLIFLKLLVSGETITLIIVGKRTYLTIFSILGDSFIYLFQASKMVYLGGSGSSDFKNFKKTLVTFV